MQDRGLDVRSQGHDVARRNTANRPQRWYGKRVRSEMECAPYRTAWVAFDDVDQECKEQAVQELFAKPFECWPLFCKRMRELYPRSKHMLVVSP